MPKTASPRCLVAHSSEDSIQLRFRVSDPILRPVSDAGVTYHRLDLEKTRPYGVPGLPEVPVITTYIAVPACDSVTLEAQIAASHVVNGVNVYPQPAYVLQNPGDGYPSERFTIDAATYARDAEFPGVPGRVVSVQYMRGQALAKVELYPVQFNPVRQRIRVLEDVNVRLRPANPRGPLRVEAGPLQGVLDAIVPNLGSAGGLSRASAGGGIAMTAGSGQVCWCESQSNNWQAAAAYVDENCTPDYLMLVADELLADASDSSLVQQLADKRAEYNGFNVAILRMGQIDDSPDITQTPPLIRNFVKAVYDSAGAAHMGDGRLGYVLLLGDAYNPEQELLLPTYHLVSPVHDQDNISTWQNGADAYYSLLTGAPFGQDLIPDVLLGRLPVDADDEDWELGNVVTKTVNYEPIAVSAAWVDSVLLVSAYDDKGFSFEGEGLSGFTNFFDAVVSEAVPSGKTAVQMHRLAVGSDNQFSSDVADSISNGYWLVGIFDHANPVNFERAFFPLHYDVLTNTEARPLAFTMGSYAGFFDVTLANTDWCCPSPAYLGIPCRVPSTPLDSCDALAERLVLQPNGLIGAVAYARTNNAKVTQRAFANFFDAVFHYNASTIGEVLVATKLLTDDHITTKNLNLLGDPAVNIVWQFSDLGDDSVDVAVSREGIEFPTAVNTYAATDWISPGLMDTKLRVYSYQEVLHGQPEGVSARA